MCGIAGFILKNPKLPSGAELEKLQDYVIQQTMAIMSEIAIRGTDAGGFAFISQHQDTLNQLVWYKDKGATTSSKFLDKMVELMTEHGLPRVFIGHARKQTKGTENNNVNNHPIIGLDNQCALVHNGIISNDDDIRKDSGIESNAEVDSEVILRLIEKRVNESKGTNIPNIFASIVKSTPLLAGNFGCAMIDTRTPSSLYLFRHGSPIAICADIDSDVLWFASTESIISDSIMSSDLIWGLLRRDKHRSFIINEIPDNYAFVLSPNNDEEFHVLTSKIEYSSSFRGRNYMDYQNQYPAT